MIISQTYLRIPRNQSLVFSKGLEQGSQLDNTVHSSPQFRFSVIDLQVAYFFIIPAGLAYSNLVYDWVKAAVMFGVINTISRLDHLDPPQPPKCITMLYVFAET